MPLNILKEISDCPTSGLKRKVKHLSFNQDDEAFNVTHKLQVHYFNDDGTPVTGRDQFKPYFVTLTADNLTRVNPQTGDIIDNIKEGDPGYADTMGQEEFFIFVNDNGMSVRPLLIGSILTGDSRKKFDI